MPQTSEGFQKILNNYKSTVESRNSMVRQLEKEKRLIDVTKWELEHQKRRGRDYNTMLDTAHQEYAAQQTKVALMSMSTGLTHAAHNSVLNVVQWNSVMNIMLYMIEIHLQNCNIFVCFQLFRMRFYSRDGLWTLFTGLDLHPFQVFLPLWVHPSKEILAGG